MSYRPIILSTITASGPVYLVLLATTGNANLATLASIRNIAICVDAICMESNSRKVGVGTASLRTKLPILELTGSAASAAVGSLHIDHNDSGGASSIVFRSKGNAESDYAFLVV